MSKLQLKKQLPPLFAQRFPDFVRYKPKQTDEEKEKFPLPFATDYFRRVRGSLWEIIGIRRLSQDNWSVEILWSIFARFPSSRLFCDCGRQNLEGLVSKPEAHTDSGTITPSTVPYDWSVWKCSLHPSDPDYQTRFIVEYMQPVDPMVAERNVVEQLQSTADVIEKYILPWFAKVEKQYLMEPNTIETMPKITGSA